MIYYVTHWIVNHTDKYLNVNSAHYSSVLTLILLFDPDNFQS